MTTAPHESRPLAKRSVWFDARDLWASMAIAVIWLAGLFLGVFGDFASTSTGGNSTTIPAGIGVSFFALFATMSVAKHGFSKRSPE
jgi:hypothetical protein